MHKPTIEIYMECQRSCPRKDDPEFKSYPGTCQGQRISLEGWELAVTEDGRIAEVAQIICGSQVSPDSNAPSISAEEYSQTDRFIAGY